MAFGSGLLECFLGVNHQWEISPRWGIFFPCLFFPCNFWLIALPNTVVDSVLWGSVFLGGRSWRPPHPWQHLIAVWCDEHKGSALEAELYSKPRWACNEDGGCDPEPTEILCVWAASLHWQQAKRVTVGFIVLMGKLGWCISTGAGRAEKVWHWRCTAPKCSPTPCKHLGCVRQWGNLIGTRFGESFLEFLSSHAVNITGTILPLIPN